MWGNCFLSYLGSVKTFFFVVRILLFAIPQFEIRWAVFVKYKKTFVRDYFLLQNKSTRHFFHNLNKNSVYFESIFLTFRNKENEFKNIVRVEMQIAVKVL
jgi:hypothetical protein